jgi:hypothetical protein
LPAALVVAALQRQPLKTRPPWRTIYFGCHDGK